MDQVIHSVWVSFSQFIQNPSKNAVQSLNFNVLCKLSLLNWAIEAHCFHSPTFLYRHRQKDFFPSRRQLTIGQYPIKSNSDTDLDTDSDTKQMMLHEYQNLFNQKELIVTETLLKCPTSTLTLSTGYYQSGLCLLNLKLRFETAEAGDLKINKKIN